MAFLFALLSGGVVLRVQPQNLTEFIVLVLVALVGLLLWSRFFRSLHRLQGLDQWLQMDFQAATIAWVERRRGKPALQNEPITCHKLVLKNTCAGISLLLIHSQNREITLTSARKSSAPSMLKFAQVLAERTRLPLEDLRED